MDEDDHLAPIMSHNWEPDAFERPKKVNDLGDSLVNRTDRLESDVSNNNFQIEKLKNRAAWAEAIFWLWLAWVLIEFMSWLG